MSIFKKKSKPAGDETSNGKEVNPYLNARRVKRADTGAILSQNQTLKVVAVGSLLIALASVGGLIHVGSQSKFIPYVAEVDKFGSARAVGPLSETTTTDPRIIRAAVRSFIENARLVTPDVVQQRNAVFSVYAMLSPQDAATQKMNEWLNGTAEANPFARASKEMVNVDINSAIEQTEGTWQVDWTETTRDRQGALISRQSMKALVTVYVAEVTPGTSEEEMNKNPLRIFVRNFSWSKQL